jgi:hypothetical protein
MVTVKYDSAGRLLWSRQSGLQGGGADLCSSPDGDLIVCGSELRATSDQVVIKYRATGDTVWVRYFDWAGYVDDARALALGPSSEVAVTGEGYSSAPGGDYVTVKYDSSGAMQWSRSLSGPADWDSPEDVAVDNEGNIVVTGSSEGQASPWDYLTVKYDAQGETLWTRRYNGTANGWDEARGGAVDSDGNVYVTGLSYVAPSHPNFATLKYAPDGLVLWTALFGGPIANYGKGNAIALDSVGNVYVCGISAFVAGGYGDYATIKYSPQGETLWVRSYNGPASDIDEALAVAVGPSGEVCVTGRSYGAGGENPDIVTIKYTQTGAMSERRSGDVPHVALGASPSVCRKSTRLEFVTETSGHVHVLVCDMSGRAVKTLVNGVLAAGYHTVVWDGTRDTGRRVPAGVYTIVLNADGPSMRVKVVVLE